MNFIHTLSLMNSSVDCLSEASVYHPEKPLNGKCESQICYLALQQNMIFKCLALLHEIREIKKNIYHASGRIFVTFGF